MVIKPKRQQGIQRISESETPRSLGQESSSSKKIGKTCAGCQKYYSYLRPEENYCTSCASRKRSFSN